MSHHENRVRIKAVARGLKEVNQGAVYLGGASISLYADEVAMPDHRPTDDVDIIIEIGSFAERIKLDERLRALGFAEDAESGVIFRWKMRGIQVDIMPTTEQIYGFVNPWYEKVFPHRYKIQLDDVEVFILPVHLLILTKWEALLHRDEGIDWRWSHDFEDIIKVMLASDDWRVRDDEHLEYKDEFHQVLKKLIADDGFFFEACRGHLKPQFYTDEQISNLVGNIKAEINIE